MYRRSTFEQHFANNEFNAATAIKSHNQSACQVQSVYFCGNASPSQRQALVKRMPSDDRQKGGFVDESFGPVH
jgi:hypothetical protein